jgi:hypothetical protein
LLTLNKGFKLHKSIKDDKLEVEHLEYYQLVLQAGPRDFQVVIYDARSSRCLLVEDYILPKALSESEYLEALEELHYAHHLLSANFWQSVKFSIKNQKFSLVPASVLDKDHLADYLFLNCDFNPEKEEALYYKHIHTDAVTVFAIEKSLTAWVRNKYPKLVVQFIHQACNLIEGVLKSRENSSDKKMYLFVDRFVLHVLVTDNRKLHYYNQFKIEKFDDYIRFIMMVMNQLGLSQERNELYLWGNISPNSAQFKELYKYIRNVSFGQKPNFLNYSFHFDEVHDHQFFDVYNAYLCE